MELYLDLLILFIRVAVFLALVTFFVRYVVQKDGENIIKHVRHLMLAFIASDALLYANLIYGKSVTLLGGSTRDLEDLIGIFLINLVAGVLALWALRGMYRIEKYG